MRLARPSSHLRTHQRRRGSAVAAIGVVALAGVLVACAQTGKPPVARLPIPEAERGDAICGFGWKWDGKRCIRSEEQTGASTAKGPTTASPSATAGSTTTSAGGLQVTEVKIGSGAEAHIGDTIRVHYTGSLPNGTVFDSSRPRGEPLEFRIGSGQVIRGFDRGVTGMRVGGIRKVVIPPDLGYGKRGSPPVIPPNATLVFELELVEIR